MPILSPRAQFSAYMSWAKTKKAHLLQRLPFVNRFAAFNECQNHCQYNLHILKSPLTFHDCAEGRPYPPEVASCH